MVGEKVTSGLLLGSWATATGGGISVSCTVRAPFSLLYSTSGLGVSIFLHYALMTKMGRVPICVMHLLTLRLINLFTPQHAECIYVHHPSIHTYICLYLYAHIDPSIHRYIYTHARTHRHPSIHHTSIHTTGLLHAHVISGRVPL